MEGVFSRIIVVEYDLYDFVFGEDECIGVGSVDYWVCSV